MPPASRIPVFYAHAARHLSRINRRLGEADLIVFQHPVRRCGMPALLKKWSDTVLDQGWPYGTGGNALDGKDYRLSATTGAGEDAYRPASHHGRPFSDFLAPFQQTALPCGMKRLHPLLFHGAQRADETAIAAHIACFADRPASYPCRPEITDHAASSPQTAGGT